MEHIDPLRRDPLRLDGAALPGRALRRLAAATAELEPLGGAGRHLQPLARARLADLTSPPLGDVAVAATLARQEPAAGGEPAAAAEERLGRRLAPAGLEPRRPRPAPRATAFPLRAVAAPPAAAPAAGVSTGPGAAARATLSAASPTSPRPGPAAGRRTPEPPAGRAAPAARRALRVQEEPPPAVPPGFEAAAGAAGLEWLADRLPGGAEASRTRLAEGAPADAGLAAPAVLRTPAPGGAGLPQPQQRTALSPAELERVLAPVRATPGDGSNPALPAVGGAGELGALVRGWQGARGEATERITPTAAPAREPASDDRSFDTGSASPHAGHADRPAGRARLPARTDGEDELLAFGDALGRVLVAELRRYGIEVDEG